MAFKQSNNPISRKTSPLRAGGFTMKDIEDKSTAEKISSIEESRSGNVGAPGDPGTRPNYNDPKKFAGDDEGMLKSTFEPQFPGDDGYEDQGMSRKTSPLNDKTGSKTIGEHGMTATKHSKHVSTVHARHNDAKDRVAEKKATMTKSLQKKKPNPAPSRKDPKYFGLGKDDGTARKIKKGNKTAKQIVKMQNKRSSVKDVYLGDPDDKTTDKIRTADKPASKREVRKIKKLKKTEKQLGSKIG